MKNKSILNVFLWLAKLTRVLITIAALVVIIMTIVSLVNPKFKHNLTPGYFLFSPVSEVTGKYLLQGNPQDFIVDSIIVNKSSFNPGRSVTCIFALNLLLTLAITIFILNEMIALLNNLLQNKIFQRENALKLRRIALAMIAGWAIMVILSILLTYLFQDSISLADYQFKFYHAGDNKFTSSIFSGLIILFIAEVFRIGTELKEENDLTI
jgi:hypothetical protein